MRKKVKSIAMSLCTMIMAIALVFGFATFNSAKADEALVLPTMVDGASVKVDAEDPALIFAATLQEVDADATYGILVVEHSLLVDNAITEDYFAKLDELGLAYEKINCNPIEVNDSYKLKAYFSVDVENLDVEYAAVAFVEMSGVYTYTELTENNVRSVSYVAQRVLEEECPPATDEATLKSWVDASKGEFLADNTVAAINVDKLNVPGTSGAEIVSFITNTYYAGGSTVEFDVFVPKAVEECYINRGFSFKNCWITVCWTDDLTTTDAYAHVPEVGKGIDVNKQITPGEWSHVEVTIPGESNVYVYLSAAIGEWGGNSMLVDNFKVTEDGFEYLEDFEGDLEWVDLHGNPNRPDGAVAAEDIIKLVNVPYVVLEQAVETGEHALKYTFNVGMDEDIPFITTDAYAAGSTVEFMYYVPEGVTYSSAWWIWAWTNTKAHTPYYAQVESPAMGANLPMPVIGEWNKVSVTLPAVGGPYYIYLASSVGDWAYNGDSTTAYVLIDNITVNGEVVEDFNTGIDALTVVNNVCVDLAEGEGYTGGTPVDPDQPTFPGEYSAALYIDSMSNKEGGDVGNFVTRDTYEAGTEIGFTYFIPADVTPSYWWIGLASDPYSIPNQYHGQIMALSKDIVGEWVTVKHTLTEAGHVFIFGSISEWGGGYALIDNFTVNGEVVEDFNNGLGASMFIYNEVAVKLGEGAPAPEVPEGPELPGEYSMKYTFNALPSSAPAMVTKAAYEGGVEVSFKYFIPEGTITSWWGIAYKSTTDDLSIYDTADRSMAHVIETSNTVLGAWSIVTFTLPAGGSYYLYIGGEINDVRWRFEDGTPSYVLIDDFTIGGVTETFNNGLAESIFSVRNSDAATLGDGFVEETVETGEYSMKLIATTKNGLIPVASNVAFPAGSTISFKYFIPEGTTTQWWRTGYKSTTPDYDANKDYYDAPYVYNTQVVGAWTDITLTLPTDAESYYIFFVTEDGGWSATYGDPYILIDDFTVNGEVVEDFNNGLAESIFDVRTTGVELGDGYVKPAAPEYTDFAAKITIDLISGTASTPSFITKEKYVSDGSLVVTFDYYMSGNLGNNWWAFFWTNDNKVASIYAHVENNKENNNGIDLPINVQDQWAKASVTIPAGEWYLYFGGSVGDWGRKDGEEGRGYVIIDNFRIGDLAFEDFNNTNNANDESDYGIFVDNRSSKPNAITLVEGKPADAEEPTPDPEPDPDPTPDPIEPGEYAAKIFIDKIKSDAGIATFVTKEKYSAGTEISFMYYIPADVTCNWFAVLCIDTQEQVDVYTDWLWQGNLVKGAWTEFTATLTKDGYIAIAGSVGDWGAKDDPKTEGYVLIDNFTIGGEVDNFNNGLTANLFDVNIDTAVVLGEGYFVAPFEPGEHAVEFDFSTSFDQVPTTFMTKEAVAQGGDTVTVQFYIPESTAVGGWWFLGWSTTKEGADFWVPDQVKPVNGGLGLGKTQGQWVTATINIPTDEEGYTYYLYVVGYQGWAGPVYMDNVVVTRGDEVIAIENFNGDPADWMFDINKAYVSYGDGYVEEEPTPDPEPDPEPTPDPDPELPEGEGYLVVDFKAFEEGRINLNTKVAYTNITELYVDIYVPRVDAFDWYGFTPASAVSGKDAYFAACTSNVGLKTSMGYYGWYDQWVTVKYVVEDGVWKPYLIMRDGTTKHKDTWNADLSGADYVADGASYIILSANPGRSYEWGMWIDNVRIVADGVTYEDNFNRGVSNLFDYSSAVTMHYEATAA